MKTLSKLVTLCLLAGMVVGEYALTESPIMTGGGQTDGGRQCIQPRWPVFTSYEATTDTISVDITHPEDGETYYVNTLWLNTTISPAGTCEYRINSNLWNPYSCSGNKCYQQVTFPENSVTVRVKCTSLGASGEDTVTFNIKTRPNIGILAGDTIFLLAPLFLALFLVVFDDDGRRRKK